MKLKRILVSLLVSVILPANVAVAEPSFGTFGAASIGSNSTLFAQPSLDRFTGRSMRVKMSAYNAWDPKQTDDTPCIGAAGVDLCRPSNRNAVAANFLPLGTRVMFPSLTGDTVYRVLDRINIRYPDTVDISMETRQEAKNFGRRSDVEMIVLD